LTESLVVFLLPASSVSLTSTFAVAFLPFFRALAIVFLSFDFFGFSFRSLEEPEETLLVGGLSL
jgi:hypothetical protein